MQLKMMRANTALAPTMTVDPISEARRELRDARHRLRSAYAIAADKNLINELKTQITTICAVVAKVERQSLDEHIIEELKIKATEVDEIVIRLRQRFRGYATIRQECVLSTSTRLVNVAAKSVHRDIVEERLKVLTKNKRVLGPNIFRQGWRAAPTA